MEDRQTHKKTNMKTNQEMLDEIHGRIIKKVIILENKDNHEGYHTQIIKLVLDNGTTLRAETWNKNNYKSNILTK